MTETEFVTLDANINLKSWDSAVSQMLADAGKLEAVFKQFQNIDVKVNVTGADLGAAERLLKDLAAAAPSVKLTVASTELDSAAKKITDIDAATADVTVTATDTELDTVVKAVADIDNAAPDVKVTATAPDLDPIQKKIDALGGIENVKVIIGDDGEIMAVKKKIDALSGTENVKVTVDTAEVDSAKKKVDALGGTEDVKVTANTDEVDTAKKKRDGLGGTEDVKIKADIKDITNALNDVKGKLQELHNLAVIQLALNATQFISGIQDLPIISTMIDIDNAVQDVTGRLERDIPGVGAIINDLYVNAWGESREEISAVIVELARWKDESGEAIIANEQLGRAAELAFSAASVGGAETSEVITAAKNLVQNDLAGSFEEAFDFIAKGYRVGFDSSGDFLDTLTEYSKVASENGISLQGFFNILDNGMSRGAFNTDKLLDSFKEFLNLSREEIADEMVSGAVTDRTTAFAAVGQTDEAQAYAAGQLTGEEFAKGVIDAIQAIEDPAEQRLRTLQIFSPTMVEDTGADVLLGTDFSKEVDFEGAADEAATALNNKLDVALTELGRTLETKLVESISAALDAPALIQKAKDAAVKIADALQSGATLGEALEIGLEIPGLNEFITRFESAIGNLLIGLLGVAREIVRITGGDTSGISAAIADLSGRQLAFDVKLNVDDPKAIADSVNTAIARGVDPQTIVENVGGAVGELLEAGKVDQAQSLIDSLGQVQDITQLDTSGLSEHTQNLLNAGKSVDETVRILQDDLANPARNLAGLNEGLASDIALLSDIPLFDTSTLNAQLTTFVSEVTAQAQEAMAAGDFDLAESLFAKAGFENAAQYVDQKRMEPVAQSILQGLDQALAVVGVNTTVPLADFATGQFEALDLFPALQNAVLGEQQDFALGGQILENMLAVDPGFKVPDSWSTTLHAALNEALTSGDTETAVDIGKLLGFSDDQMTAVLSTVETNLTAVDTSVQTHSMQMQTALEGVGTATENIPPAFTEVQSAADSSLPGAGETIKTFAADGTAALDPFAGALSSVSGSLVEIATNADAAAAGIGKVQAAAAGGVGGGGGVTTTAPEPQGHAAGGIAEGFSMFGERGPELATADTRLAVLNNLTTDRIFTALRGALSGAPMSGSRTSNINIYNNFQTTSTAQGMAAGLQVAKNVRGFNT